MKRMSKILFLLPGFLLLFGCKAPEKKAEPMNNISGIYPHLAYYNNEAECEIGRAHV